MLLGHIIEPWSFIGPGCGDTWCFVVVRIDLEFSVTCARQRHFAYIRERKATGRGAHTESLGVFETLYPKTDFV